MRHTTKAIKANRARNANPPTRPPTRGATRLVPADAEDVDEDGASEGSKGADVSTTQQIGGGEQEKSGSQAEHRIGRLHGEGT